jgi:uncharacterized protein (DUF2235 family)
MNAVLNSACNCQRLEKTHLVTVASIGGRMSKNIVLCCDGTGNEIEGNLSNVLKLFRIAVKNVEQRVYYSPGIGTISTQDPWTRLKQNTRAVFGLVTGYGLDTDILGAYRFLSRHFEQDDNVFLFGFSRGAYTVRALAGFVHMLGLLPPDQLNIAGYALTAYKRASEASDFDIAWNFRRVAGSRRATIHFIGAWDTVSSVFVPRPDRIFPMLQTLPYTRTNPSVKIFRHAISIDERRRMFRLNRWSQNQTYVSNPFDENAPTQQQDVKQVWFAGAHADIGGGYAETESGLSKYPLAWMIDEAVAHGLKINTATKNELVLGHSRSGREGRYVAPDPKGHLHESLTATWQPLEWVPKSARWMEWPRRKFLGQYIPDAEPRLIAELNITPLIHSSVVERLSLVPEYRPTNLPVIYNVEP